MPSTKLAAVRSCLLIGAGAPAETPAVRLNSVANGGCDSWRVGRPVASLSLWFKRQGKWPPAGASPNTEGVGRATTKAVVQSIFLVIVADLLFTAFFYLFWSE